MHINFKVIASQSPLKMVFDEEDTIIINKSKTPVSKAIAMAKSRLAEQIFGVDDNGKLVDYDARDMPRIEPVPGEGGVVLHGYVKERE